MLCFSAVNIAMINILLSSDNDATLQRYVPLNESNLKHGSGR
jgi:hypothetical protein